MRVLVKEQRNVKIDLIDKKILYLLSVNSRFSYSTISKHVKLSREAVKQRVEKLRKNDVLLGFQTVINVNKLGYSSYHLFSQLSNPTKIVEDDFVSYLLEKKSINALLKYTGHYDFEISYMLKNIKELNNELRELSSKDIKRSLVYTILNTIVSRSFPQAMYDFSLEIEKVGSDGSFFSNFSKKRKSKLKLDQNDYKIISIMADDARIPMIDLAKKTGLGVDTVIYRVRKLIESGIIIAFRSIINYADLGYSVYCLFFKLRNFTEEKERSFNNYLKENKNVLWSANCMGAHDNISYLLVKDTYQFHDVLYDIRERFNDILQGFDFLLSFAEYKFTYFPEVIKFAE